MPKSINRRNFLKTSTALVVVAGAKNAVGDEGDKLGRKQEYWTKNKQAVVKLHPGKIIYSKNLTFQGGSHSSELSIVPTEKAMDSKLPKVPKSPSNHFENFLLACKDEEKTRSPFEVAGPLSQVFCLGVIAQRLSSKIIFDRKTKQITNNKYANEMLVGAPPRKDWEEFYKL